MTSTCPAYVADDTPRAASPRAAQPSSCYTLKYYTLSSWRIAAFHSILLPRESHTPNTHTRALGTQSQCRPSSTTRCRRRCEVSTGSLPLYLKHHLERCAWHKRQQWVEQVALVVLWAHCTAQETTCRCDRISSASFVSCPLFAPEDTPLYPLTKCDRETAPS